MSSRAVCSHRNNFTLQSLLGMVERQLVTLARQNIWRIESFDFSDL
jgi:hypothetical protein